MRSMLCLCGLALLFLAGCSADNADTHTVYVTGSDAIQILAPAPNETLRVVYHWREGTYPDYYFPGECPWAWEVDTAFAAIVQTQLPGGVHSAQAYERNGHTGSFYPTGPRIYPAADSFSFPFYSRWDMTHNFYGTGSARDGELCIGITTGDESFVLSRTIPYTVLSMSDALAALPPEAPLADTVTENRAGTDYLSVSWCNPSPGVALNLVYLRSPYGITTTEVMQTYYRDYVQFPNYLPATDYQIWVLAMGDHGISDASDTLRLHTGDPSLPTGLHSYQYLPPAVTLRWNNHRTCDSLLVARRETTGDWTVIGSCANSCSYYDDATAATLTNYYYRLGLAFPTGTWWSPDSLFVAVP